jgi:hypothetical protein
VQFAGIDIGLAGVAGRIDQEVWLLAAEESREGRLISVIKIGPPEITKKETLALE